MAPKCSWGPAREDEGALGLAYTRKAELTGSLETLPAARKHFDAMLQINPHLAEADQARKYMAKIDTLLKP